MAISMVLTKSIERPDRIARNQRSCLGLYPGSYTYELLGQGGDGDPGEHLCAAGDSGGACSVLQS